MPRVVFLPGDGIGPDIAGTRVANPIAMILSAAMMCPHLEREDFHRRIRRAVAHVTSHHKEALTPDLGGTGTARGLTDAIVAALPEVSDAP